MILYAREDEKILVEEIILYLQFSPNPPVFSKFSTLLALKVCRFIGQKAKSCHSRKFWQNCQNMLMKDIISNQFSANLPLRPGTF